MSKRIITELHQYLLFSVKEQLQPGVGHLSKKKAKNKKK